ncbi:MAG: exo-alpha-sialidase [Actinobacteria bacterium]|nr:exo-alpha-sialidase [Actinomycetota bacterium]
MTPSSRVRSKQRKPSRSKSRPNPVGRQPRKGPPPAPRTSRWALLGGLVAAIAIVAGVIAFSGGDGRTADRAAVKLEHVHGLGVDPGSGDLYAGSHHGLIRLPERGQPSRVGGLVQDFMGFTVAGRGHFLASGHPGKDQDGPANLGLIESTDGGRSWQSLSLAGEADFHSLEAGHGLIYGSHAGQLMVSQDGRTWDNRARLAVADLAVSPEDPQTLLATTRDGLAQSTNGGREFQLVAGAPLLQLVTWPDPGSIVGVAPDGAVHTSTDGGTTWEQRGSVDGAPEALTTDGGEIYVAVEGSIVRSTDAGRTFPIWYAAD